MFILLLFLIRRASPVTNSGLNRRQESSDDSITSDQLNALKSVRNFSSSNSIYNFTSFPLLPSIFNAISTYQCNFLMLHAFVYGYVWLCMCGCVCMAMYVWLCVYGYVCMAM